MDTALGRFGMLLVQLTLLACNVVDDEPHGLDTGSTDGAVDQRSCLEAANEFFEQTGCLPGYQPQVFYDGGGSVILLADDPGGEVGFGVGLVVQFGGGVGADWVGYGVSQSSQCSYGCFLPSCQDGQQGCYARGPSIGLCGHYCADMIDQQACNDLQEGCLAADPAVGHADDDGGLDETGGGETSGGVLDEPYDCGQWHPEGIHQPMPDGPIHVPQAIVDQLVLDEAEPLAECEGLRLRPGRDGYWAISKMRSDGLLGALGLRVGDELRALDDIELNSLDALVSILGRFITEDGHPRRVGIEHHELMLRVRRDQQDLERRLRVR